MKTKILSKLFSTIALVAVSTVGYAQIQTLTYTDTFRTGIAATAAQKTTWDNYRATLTTNHCWTSVQIKGTYSAGGRTTSDPATIAAIAAALRTGIAGTFAFGANTWRVGTCGTGVELSCNSFICNCINPAYSIRPGGLSTIWGGVGTTNCNAPNQRITVIFSYLGTPSPAPAAGPDSVCENSTQVYTCDTVLGATSYNWSLPAGAVILSGQSTTTLTVIFGGPVVGHVKVYADGPCGPGVRDSTPVQVFPYPVITMPAFPGTCDNIAPFALTGGLPLGGTYSGNGVAAGMFDPIAAGPGTHSITYTVSANGCTSSLARNITVYSATPCVLAPFVQNCSYTAAYPLTGGLPVGGVYSGVGVIPGQMFDPAVAGVGSHLITYSYASPYGCIAIDTQRIVVNQSPTVTMGQLSPVCVDATPFALSGGLPLGGTYYGNGVSNGMFDANAAGVGTHTITYIYADITTCADTASTTITVNPLPLVTLSQMSAMCENEAAILLNGGAPAGGVYSGNGVNAGMFDPAVAGQGGHTITYTYTDGNGCVNSAYQTVIVLQAPIITFPVFSPTTVCMDSANVQNQVSLNSALPAGGNYIGNGVVANIFYPSIAGPGAHVVTYIYTNGFGCTDSAQRTITVTNCTGIEEGLVAVSAQVYPNPNNGDFTLSIDLNTTQNVSLTMSNALGQVIYQSEQKLAEGTSKLILSIKDQQAGIYFMQVKTDTGLTVKRIILE